MSTPGAGAVVGSWRTLLLALIVGGLLPVATVAFPPEDRGGEDRYRALEQLPTTARDVNDIEPTAIELVHALGSVPAGEDLTGVPCPRQRLEVSWERPEGFTHGAFVGAVGPPPSPDSTAVGGTVVCSGSTYAFAGFEAVRQDDGSWTVAVVPVFPEEADLAVGPEPLPRTGAPDQDPPPTSLADLDALDLGPIDPYAPYEPQRICDADPKPGTVALARLLLEFYPETRSLGIARDCGLGTRSEHKEGRAFDWGARITDPDERDAVSDLLARLLATDDDGNVHALARRLGVMYLIWNGQIWASHRADDGWRPYDGPSAHVDHVHVSLSWDGATGRTSLWEAALTTGWWAAFPALESSNAEGDTGETASPERHGRLTLATAGRDPAGREDERDGTAGDGGNERGPDDETVGDTEETIGDAEETVDEATETVEDSVDDAVEDVPVPVPTETPTLPDIGPT